MAASWIWRGAARVGAKRTPITIFCRPQCTVSVMQQGTRASRRSMMTMKMKMPAMMRHHHASWRSVVAMRWCSSQSDAADNEGHRDGADGATSFSESDRGRHPLDLGPMEARFAYTFERQFVLILPESADGSGRLEFRFTLGDSVGKVNRQLTMELGRSITLMSHDGHPLEDGVLLVDIAATGFAIQDGANTRTVPPIRFEGNLPRKGGGHLHLMSLMQKSSYMRARKILESDPRARMSYREALEVCTSCGMAVEEASRLLEQLHDIGSILHFKHAKDEALRHTVFLKPEEVADSVFSEFGLLSPTQLFVKEQAAKKQAQLTELRGRYDAMKTLHDVLAARASSTARTASWLGFGALGAGVGFYWWLVYDFLSWDIMEPVTYFTGAFFAIVGFMWWHHSSSEFEYGNLLGAMYRRRLKRLHEKHNFDMDQFERLTELLRTVEAEVRHLDMTGYNPALIAAYLGRNAAIYSELNSLPGDLLRNDGDSRLPRRDPSPSPSPSSSTA